MKNILGIVAEYNPLHQGHAYQMSQARAETGCDYIVVAMSGNFVQRGEPAIVDKWVRGKMAVAVGADLVVEIPAGFSLQSAEGFARAGITLLQNCGVSHLSFGSESGRLEELEQLARWLQKPPAQGGIRATLAKGITYAAAVQQAAVESEPVAGLGHLFRGPNNILAIEYLRLLAGTDLAVHTLKRREEFAAASQIRRLIARGNVHRALCHIPPACRGLLADTLKNLGPVFSQDFSQAIFYALTDLGVTGIRSLPACSEGLENRLWRGLARAANLPELLLAVKTKRYPLTRLQRLLLQALLRFDRGKFPLQVPYLRILAASPRGKELLPTLARSPLPLLYSARDHGKLTGQARRVFEGEVFAERVYGLAQLAVGPGTRD